MGSTIGYARVSTSGHVTQGTSLESQEATLTAAGASRVFNERGVSGAKASRPQLDALLDYIRPGDTILVTSLDRLGRSVHHLVGLVEELREKDVALRSLREGIDTSGPAGRLVFSIFASLAEFERAMILERTAKGREAAASKGRVGGRPRKQDPKKAALARRLYDAGGMSAAEIAHATGVSVSTMYRLLRSTDALGASKPGGGPTRAGRHQRWGLQE